MTMDPRNLWYPLESVQACVADLQGLIAREGCAASAGLSERFPTVGNGDVGIVIEIDGRLGAAAEAMADEIIARRLGEDAYLELWDAGVAYVPVGMEELPLGSPERPIELGWESASSDYPSAAVMHIHRLWGHLAAWEDDAGGCVLGDSIEMELCGKSYRLMPMDGHQGSLPREKWLDEVMSMLRKAGCESVRYNPGRLD